VCYRGRCTVSYNLACSRKWDRVKLIYYPESYPETFRQTRKILPALVGRVGKCRGGEIERVCNRTGTLVLRKKIERKATLGGVSLPYDHHKSQRSMINHRFIRVQHPRDRRTALHIGQTSPRSRQDCISESNIFEVHSNPGVNWSV
jgi:hypothetical protein